MNLAPPHTMARPKHQTRRDDRRRPRRGVRRPRVIGRWKHGPIPVLGLIGGIGAGKSTAAAAMVRRGAFRIDADAVGHALLQQRPARDLVLRRFGPEILAPRDDPQAEPEIDRRALGAIVFDDPGARRELEAILHPRMRRTFERAIARTIRRGRHSAVVLDAAVLLEAGWDDLCDRIVFVDAPRERRLARLASSRGWTAEDLAAREAAQWPLEEKRERADVVLSNDGEPARLDEQVGRLWSENRLSVKPETRP